LDKKQLNSLIVRIKQEDEIAFEEFYNLTNKCVFSFVYNIVHNRQDSEDLVQDTFIKFKRNILMFKDGTNPTAWLFQIAKNLSIDFLRKQKHDSGLDIEDVQGFVPENESKTNITDKMYLHDLMFKVLSEEERMIVDLHMVGGYKNREIAKILNLPLGTVLWKYNQAMKTLKKKIEEDRNEK